MAETVLRLSFAALVGYALLAGLVWWRQRDLMYPASRTPPDLARAALPGFAQVTVSTTDGERLVAWWKPPSAPHGRTVLFLHGNGGSLDDRRDRAALLTRDGTGLLLLSYRGYGASTGSPSEEGLHADALAAFDWIAASAPGSPVVVYGESLGSGVAVRLAGERPVAGLVLDAAFTSAADVARRIYWWLPVDLLMADRFPSEERLRTLPVPVLSLHGDRDGVVPFDLGERLHAVAPGPKRFVRIPGGDHMGNLENGGLAEVHRFIADPERAVAAR